MENIARIIIGIITILLLILIYLLSIPIRMLGLNDFTSKITGGFTENLSNISGGSRGRGSGKTRGRKPQYAKQQQGPGLFAKSRIHDYRDDRDTKEIAGADDPILSNQQREIIAAYRHILNNRGLAGAIYEYKDINYSLNYSAEYVTEVLKCHIGQRKLNNTELQFYSRFIDRTGKNTLVIYIGSASGEHTGFILKRFPGIKILMIDPNFHNMEVPHMYIKQQLDRISQDTINTFTEFLRADTSKDNAFARRMKKLKDGAEKLRKMRFIYSDDPVDVLDAAREFRNTGEIDADVDYNNEMFEDEYANLVAYIMKSKTDVFVIQDYATVDLAEKLRESITVYNSDSAKPLNVLFVSDIRTTIMSDREPSALDLVWNNHLHSTMLKIIKPDYTMLKFHPPYFDDIDFVKKFYCDITGEVIADFDETKSKSENVALARGDRKGIYDFVIADIKDMQKYSDTGLVYDKSADKFRYYNLQHKHIFIQSWQPRSSSEVRLIIAKSDIGDARMPEYAEYNPDEWENKFYYYKFFRMAWAEDAFIEKLNASLSADSPAHTFDGCPDCYIEIRIIAEYLLLRDPMFASEFGGSAEKITNDIILKFMNKREFCEKIAKISGEITDAVYFPAGKSSKCPGHGMRNELNVLYPYFIHRDDNGNIFLIVVEVRQTGHKIISKSKVIKQGNRLKFIPPIRNITANDGTARNIVAVDGTPMEYRVFERMLLEDVY